LALLVAVTAFSNLGPELLAFLSRYADACGAEELFPDFSVIDDSVSYRSPAQRPPPAPLVYPEARSIGVTLRRPHGHRYDPLKAQGGGSCRLIRERFFDSRKPGGRSHS